MIDYQKLATMVFRIIGCFFFVLAVTLGLMCFSAPFFNIGLNDTIFIFLFYAVPLTVLGSIFWFLSRKLATFVCKRLD